MKLNLYSFLFVFCVFPYITQAQYCTSGGPSSTADSNIESVYIAGENGTSINYSGCPGTVGLDNQTALTVDLEANNSYNLFVQFGTCGGNYPGEGSVYIDFNQNQTFEFSELIGSWAGTPPTAVSQINFTVPAGTVNGLSRMRVIQAENATNPIDPCLSFTWGSMTDFTVNFTQGVDCSGYVGDEMADPRIISSLPYTESYSTGFCYSNQDPVYNSPDIYYRLIATDYNTDFLNVSLCGSSFDTYLSIQDLDTNILFVNDDYDFCSPQSELTFPIAGLDTIFIVVQGWGNNSGDYNISVNDATVASINESPSFKAQVYPNPAIDYVDISINSNEKVNLSIHNSAGQLMSTEIFETSTRVETTNFPSGLYFITLTSDEAIIQKKIIIKP